MDFEIIDFHTHPFIEESNNICNHKHLCGMSADNTLEVFKRLGVSKICGSVIKGEDKEGETKWDKIRRNNDIALELKDYYKGFYIPGFHVHPEFIDESITEIRKMSSMGVNLIGELVPYIDGWSNYACEGFSVILDEASKHNMVVNIHSQGEDEMDEMVKAHKDVIFVAAHPGEYDKLMRHIERMKRSENYYIDRSGTGLFRYGMLKRVVDTIGADRVLFGSDFPTCTPGMFLGGVLYDDLITDAEKEKIFSLNAKRLLGI